MEDSGSTYSYGPGENGHEQIGPAAMTAIKTEITRQDLAVLEFLNRVDRLYRELLDVRDRELAAKDRLIVELERRAQIAEEHEQALRSYLSQLPEPQQSQPQPSEPAAPPIIEHSWWRFWR